MTGRQPPSDPRSGRVDRHTHEQTILSVLRRQGPLSQAGIARATSLSRATVNNIVQSLRDQGAVEYQWKNGRESLVTLVSTRGSVISMLVRENAVRASLFDFARQIRHDTRVDDQQSSPALALDVARRLIEAGRAHGSPVAGVALAIEGPLETSTGAIAPWAWQRLPQWKGIDILPYFSRHLHLPLVVDNDANLAALAEWSWGEGRGCDDFLHVTCAEGIGGGIILNGRIYRGGTGLAGEIGHLVLEESGGLCFCGSRGCLSSFATERAILAALRHSEQAKTTLAEVVESARQGDAACQRVLFEAGSHLGEALATVFRVMGPSVIAIGGTLATGGDIVLDGLRSSAEVINLRAIGQSPRFCIATLIDHAPELGGVSALLCELNLGASTLSPWMQQPRPLVSPAA